VFAEAARRLWLTVEAGTDGTGTLCVCFVIRMNVRYPLRLPHPGVSVWSTNADRDESRKSQSMNQQIIS
jgi:hypothetical protein